MGEQGDQENQTSQSSASRGVIPVDDVTFNLAAINRKLSTFAAAVTAVLNSDSMKSIAQSMERFGHFIERNHEQILSFGEALRNLPDKLKGGVAILAERGWFVDDEMGMSDIFTSQRAAHEGSPEQVDATMVDYFEQRLDAIEERLVELAPTRARILRAAFDAVRRGDDDLAVPILLMQADGLCFDHGLGNFFVRDKKLRNVPLAMKRLGDRGVRLGLFHSPVYQILPLYMTSNERGEAFTGLNRHQVLHGESVDYGTHENSLRAVSFLNCIALILRDGVSDKSEGLGVEDATEESNP